MNGIRKHARKAPSKCESAIEELVGWRAVMEREFPLGNNIMSIMHARNCVGAYRDRLARSEWFPCPSCGGRGLWVDQDGRNRYCKRCTGTGILLVCEQDTSISDEAPPTGWRSWLRRLVHLDPRKNVITKRRS